MAIPNIGGRGVSGPIYSCAISGVAIGLRPGGQAAFTHCYVISARSHVLDVTNTAVYERNHGRALGLSCS